MRGIRRAGWTAPRPIQAQAIPALLAGRDVLGLAPTGTGKTAAFAIPMIERLLGGRRGGTRALVVAPTRELATQIAAEIRRLAVETGLRVATVFGGVGERPQIAALRRGADIVVACPGRLVDLLSRRLARLDRVEMLVLDEADHMFDMGFLPDIRRVLAALPPRRQNLLFSATMPRQIRALADRLLVRPHVVDLTGGRLETIAHELFPVQDRQKRAALDRLLSEPGCSSAIVFTRTKHRARRLAEQLAADGRRAVALQGNMTQAARDRAMRGFRDRRYEVLVATDIAARGIDVSGVSHVINFDMPDTVEAYTHRIGRTGRGDSEGRAYTLVTAADRAMVRRVEQRLGDAIPRRALAGLAAPAAGSPPSARAPRGRRPGRRRR
ncbi:MAG: DEAD/DEAH box helicase [Acidobacteria bacterium]|nr:MAG: DEAD/DEAH box helicase [Acidobacteriota bacterium]